MTQTPPRNLPRFLPTLTEVVRAPFGTMHPSGAAIDAEQLVKRVMEQVHVNLKPTIQAAIQDMVREQLLVLEPLIMQEIELAIRQAVQESLSSHVQMGGSASTV